MLSSDKAQQVIAHSTIALLAVILLGGTMLLLLLGRNVPEFLVGFDGVIVTAAFSSSGFFAVARTAAPTALALTDTLARYHDLAMAGTLTTSPTQSGTTGTTEAHSQ